MIARRHVLLGLALAGCAASSDGPPGFGGPRPLYDIADATPPWCVLGDNCTHLRVDCVEPVPDGEGGAWCRQPFPANVDVMQLVHVGGDGAEVSTHRLGNRVYPRLALSSANTVAGSGSGVIETFAGVPAGALTEAQRGGGWVGARRPDGTGWHHYFGTGVQFEDVAWLSDGRLAVLGTCTGAHTVPLDLDCSGSPGSSLFLFNADGSTLERRALSTVTTPRKVAVGPGDALYVLDGSAALHRLDEGHAWTLPLGNGVVTHAVTPLVVSPDGRAWLTVGFPAGASFVIGERTLGAAGPFAGGMALLVVSPGGVVEAAQASSNSAWANGITGFAPMPGGDVLAFWEVSTGELSTPGFSVAPHELPSSRLVQHLSDGSWRGVRALGPKANGGTVEVFADTAGRVYLNNFGLPEAPGVHFVRIDPPAGE